jgi:hypothetical protein
MAMNPSVRTKRQNDSIHLYCTQLAEAMNEAGYDLKTIVEMIVKAGVPLTKDNVKETIWKPIQMSMFTIDSTTALDTKQVSEVYETINRDIVPTGIHIPFPSITQLIDHE